MGREKNSRQREKHRQSPGSGGEHGQGGAQEGGGEVGAEAWRAAGGRSGWRGSCVLTRKGILGLAKNFFCILSERLWAQPTEIKPPRFPMQMRTSRMKSHQRWTTLRKNTFQQLCTWHLSRAQACHAQITYNNKEDYGELVAIARDLHTGPFCASDFQSGAYLRTILWGVFYIYPAGIFYASVNWVDI